MKTLLPLPFAIACTVLLSASGIAAATEDETQSVSFGNTGAITLPRPVERQATIAIYPDRPIIRQAATFQAQPQQTEVRRVSSGNGSIVTFEAPSQ